MGAVPRLHSSTECHLNDLLIAAGRRGTASSTPESRFIEVTRDAGAVVWELRLPKDHGVYRAERRSTHFRSSSALRLRRGGRRTDAAVRAGRFVC
jgi:hypothetical protein